MNPVGKLAKIKEILGSEVKGADGDYLTINYAYYELEGALQNIENRTIDTDINMGITKVEDTYKIDKTCLDTIKRVQQQIADVMKLLKEPNTYDEISAFPEPHFNEGKEYIVYATQGQGEAEIGRAKSLSTALTIADETVSQGVGVAIKYPDGSWHSWVEDHWVHP